MIASHVCLRWRTGLGGWDGEWDGEWDEDKEKGGLHPRMRVYLDLYFNLQCFLGGSVLILSCIHLIPRRQPVKYPTLSAQRSEAPLNQGRCNAAPIYLFHKFSSFVYYIHPLLNASYMFL